MYHLLHTLAVGALWHSYSFDGERGLLDLKGSDNLTTYRTTVECAGHPKTWPGEAVHLNGSSSEILAEANWENDDKITSWWGYEQWLLY